MEYAIIQQSGKQFLVKPGDTISVLGTLGQEGKSLNLDSVLLVKSPKKLDIGQPTVPAQVTAKVVAHQKTPKVRVATYKAKSRYRRVEGHRQPQTVLQITAIKAKSASKTTPKAKSTPKTKTTK